MQLYYLSRRKDSSIWYVALRDPVSGQVGTKKSTGTTIRREAETIAQLWLRDGMPRTSKESYQTFVEFLDHFWDFDNSKHFKEMVTMGKNVSRRHANDMRNVINRYYTSYWGRKRLKDIDELQLQDFLVWLKTDRGLSASTVNLARNAAFVAIKFAKRHRLLRVFDFDAVLRCSGKPKGRGILEREEVQNVFEAEWRDERSKLINFIASQTGMRMGEIRALQIRDIVLNKIYVRHAWSRADGGLKCPKNGEEREIPLLPVLKDAIEAYLENKPFMSNPDALLFPSEVPGVPYDEKQVVEDFYRVLSSIGIGDNERKTRNIVFHSWRHYCAKNLAAVTTKSIGMKILGHKTSVMFDHYSDHVDKETFKAMEEAMSNGLGSKATSSDVIEFVSSKKIG
jgi:integrase